MVNVVFYGTPDCGDGGWVLIDTGLAGMSGRIISAANERFGEDARPAAIIMTHGHSDHAGSLEKLAAKWDVPVYAHPEEMPYLNGTAAYPPADISVGGGLITLLSPLFPRGPFDVYRWLKPLPSDGTLPGMPGWRWLHTPGHSVGHVSFWRQQDRVLIVGDAFITTNIESAYAVVVQAEEIHGPPAFLTTDWDSARRSVQNLAALDPEIVITGHGRAMRGPEIRAALQKLARDFDTIAVPEHSRYRMEPANFAKGAPYRAP